MRGNVAKRSGGAQQADARRRSSGTTRHVPELRRLLAALDRNDHARGRQWERVCRWYLANDPLYKSQIRRTWLWRSWPGRWGRDAGIDLVAELRDGSLMAVQAKAYAENYYVTKADLDSFLSESSRPKFSRRLLIATTNHLGPTALRTIHAQKVPAKFLALGDLERAQVDWPASPDDLRPRRLPPKKPRPHQRIAVAAVRKGFAKSDRGKVVMACGTGKTLVGLWCAEALRSSRTLLLFPSLTLLAQTLREWTMNATRPFQALAVCSDATVYDPDAFVEHTSDLDIKVTTDAKVIRAFLRGKGPRVVFGTYQSSTELAKAMKANVPTFDLAIADEAHRCAGVVAGEFATILDARAIKAKRRLFMTATPRYFTGRIKREALESDYELASMDDIEHFGPTFYELSFGTAIEKDLLSNYQVAIVGIDDKTYRDYAQRGVFVTTDGKKVTDARTLAGQIGLARAMRKFDLRRTISFHSRIAGARSFSASVPGVIAWMPARTRPGGELWSKFISGEMPSGERDTLLGSFRELARGQRGLLSNARCLAEGVDVPAIDGVAFIDPRGSQIDIVQAVGRAIRKSEGKKIGTIVLPVFIEATGKPEVALDSTAFKPVWAVLKALRAHDAELGEQLDALRRELGRRAAGKLRLPAKIRFDLPVAVDRRFADALHVRVVEQTTASWEFWLGLLQAFVGRDGSALVPYEYATSDGHRLGAWVNTNRWLYRKGKLGRDRIAVLETLRGWSWNPLEDDFNEGLRRLRIFVARERHARVPAPYQTPDGFRLGKWVSHTRAAYDEGRLSADRVSLLAAVRGWTWDVAADAFSNGLSELRAFVAREHHARVPRSYTSRTGYRLGVWVSDVRSRRRQGTLSRDQIAQLDAIPGWTWHLATELREAAFTKGVRELKAFAVRTGHLRVPETFTSRTGYRLGTWLLNCRQRYRAGTLTPDRIAQLEEIRGWTWHPFEEKFDRGLGTLRAFVSREHHARVPTSYVSAGGYNLGSWIRTNRSEYRIGKLSKDRIAQLEAVPGWTWSPFDDAFRSGIGELLRFIARKHHARVPAQYKSPSGYRLGFWVAERREQYRSRAIPRVRLAELKRALGSKHLKELLPGWS